MQGITDTLNQGMSSAKNKFDEISTYLKSNPKITAMLLAGGGAGLAGGALTAAAPERNGETSGSRRMRILRNALLTAGAGAGTVGLGMHAADSLENALPVDSKHPAEQALTNWKTRGVAGTAAALAGAAAGNKRDVVDMGGQAQRAMYDHVGKNKALDKDTVNSIANSSNSEKINYYNHKRLGPALSPKTPVNAFVDKMLQFSMPNSTAGWNAQATKHPVKHVAKNLTNKLVRALVGRTRAGHAARLAGGGALMFPEIIGGAKDFLGALTEGE